MQALVTFLIILQVWIFIFFYIFLNRQQRHFITCPLTFLFHKPMGRKLKVNVYVSVYKEPEIYYYIHIEPILHSCFSERRKMAKFLLLTLSVFSQGKKILNILFWQKKAENQTVEINPPTAPSIFIAVTQKLCIFLTFNFVHSPNEGNRSFYF